MKRALILAVLLGPLALAASAFGRAGGGHSFSGGSHSSSSGSSHSSSSSGGWHSSGSSSSAGWHSSSSGGSSSSDVPAPCACVVVLLVIGVIVVLRLAQGRAADRGSAAAIEARQEEQSADNRQSAQQIQAGLSRIKARDPSFDAEALVGRMTRLFVEMQHAWSTGSFAEVRRAMSDGVLRRFTVQLALNRFFGKRNLTCDVKVAEAGVVGVEADDEFDTVHLRFAASAKDCDVPAKLAEAEAFGRAARAQESSFVETWSFVRRLNPDFSAGRLSEGKCPSCGAPVPRQATVTCEWCQAILNSGTYDWVLAEITQEGEFKLQPVQAVEGFARLKAGDPAANRQVLEDRANLVFWKWIEARATGEARRLARLCTARSLNELEAGQGRPDPSLSQAAVGGVDLALVQSEADFERATFEVRWSTAGAGTGLVRTSALTLARKAGVKTLPKAGMSTDRCHGCGAVQTESEAVQCSHCQALLSQDWAFEDLASIDAFRARRRAAQEGEGELAQQIGAIASPWERSRALAVMVAMARADGVVTESERRLLDQCARRWGIEQAQLAALLAGPLVELASLAPKSLDESRVLYRALVAAALVDGRIDASEKRLLEAMAAHLRIAADEAQATIRELKAALGKKPQG